MCKQSVFWIMAVVLALVAIPQASHAQVVNLLKNPSFEEDEPVLDDADWSTWTTWNPAEGAGSNAEIVDTEAIDGTQSLQVDPVGNTNWFFIPLQDQIPLDVGTTYTLSFWAKAEEDRPLFAKLKATDNSSDWGQSNYDLTTDWAEYTFTAAALNASAKLEFHSAGVEVTHWLDFVHLYEGEYVEIIPSALAITVVAADPRPATEATDVPLDSALTWQAGEFAATHNIYLGTAFDDVSDASAADPRGVLVSEGQNSDSFDPGRLPFGQTHYWRVDEVNGAPDNTVFEGDVWSFTVEPFSIPINNITATASGTFGTSVPENTINGSGMVDDLHGTSPGDMWISSGVPATIEYAFDRAYKLHELWIWNSNQLIESFVGFGAKDVVIEHSLDGGTWTVLEGVGALAQAPATPGYAHNNTVDFGGAMAQNVRVTVNSVQGIAPQTSLSEVRFFFIPVNAREPDPADGATVEAVNTTLSWRSGREAAEHEVVLSPDQAAVADGTAVTVVTQENSYRPDPLVYGETYYWQVTETNAVGTPPSHAGPIWSFMAPEYLTVDDFEIYRDEEFFEIWSVWIDGFEDDTNGAIVGNGNEAETDVVHEGRQSMPILYDNTGAPISAVTRTFDPPLDWTEGSPEWLSLHLHGNAPDFIEHADGRITLGAAGADIWNTSDEFRYAYQRLSGDGSIIARVNSLTAVHDSSKAGVMIRESGAPDSANVYLFNTGNRGVLFEGRRAFNINSESAPGGLDGVQENIARDEPVWLRIERVGNDINGYYSLEETATNWTALAGNPWNVPMASDVLIGLALTSHSAGNTVVGEFSDVSTTGNVSGAWTAEAIGGEHPDNDAAQMYVTVTDTAGRAETAVHPSLGATQVPVWEPWSIPLAGMSTLNLGSIQSITIGVGEPGGAPSGATGTMYIDLLRVGTSRLPEPGGPPVNLLTNGSFEEDELVLDDPDWSTWTTWNPAEGAGSNAVIVGTEAIDGAQSLRVDPVGDTNWYFIVIQGEIPLVVDQTYTASFWAKAAADRPFFAQLKAMDNSVSWGGTSYDLSTEWAEYTFTSAALNDTAKLELFCAGVEVPLWLDFVSLYEDP